MKAIVSEKFGSVENLCYKEIEKPAINANEVLIKVEAISINPVDVKVRARQASLAADLAKYTPLILGWDISGEIVVIGKEVTSFKEGDKVGK